MPLTSTTHTDNKTVWYALKTQTLFAKLGCTYSWIRHLVSRPSPSHCAVQKTQVPAKSETLTAIREGFYIFEMRIIRIILMAPRTGLEPVT